MFSGETHIRVGKCKRGLLKHHTKTNSTLKYVHISNIMAKQAVGFFKAS